MVAFAPPPPPASPRPPVVCARCGVGAPRQGEACAACQQPLRDARVTAPVLGGDAYWVAVRCGFQCRSCNFLAPLDHLDTDGTVECVHCGLRQRFDVTSWKDALALAHAVGDLAGPDPEGRRPHPLLWIGSENPHRAVGDTETFGELKQTGSDVVDGLVLPRSLQIEAAPGCPLCKRCRVPLDVAVPQRGRADSRCPRCGDSASYTVAAQPTFTLAPGLLAVLADEHRTDRPRARSTTTDAGAEALRCPGCGAPLSLASRERVVSCQFCKTACLIPARALMAPGQEAPPPAVWWLLFKGPSQARTELEAPVEPAAADDMKKVLGKLRFPGMRGAKPDLAPGIYEAPPVPGIPWAQVLFTLAAGSVAVAIGYLIAGS